MTTELPFHGQGERCLACEVIDGLDGIRDGRLFHADHWTSSRSPNARGFRGSSTRDFSEVITNFAGSMAFVWFHLLWFGFWIAENLGLFGDARRFDRFPFGLLTMIVSLEAIFLSTFVMISQNRQAARTEKRDQIDAESNIQTLIWLLHLATVQGIDVQHVRKLCDQTVAEMRAGGSVGSSDDRM